MRLRFSLLHIFLLISIGLISLTHAQTTFNFGGYVKLDMMSTSFNNGPVTVGSPLRDFHFPAAIPVGGTSNVFTSIDYHAKESRFNFGTETKLGDHVLKAFVEMDFLLAGQGDERVSNSWNPRMRHFYFTFDDWLFGQTWTTFQILDLPEDLDFAGAADGIIFNRQPLIRYTMGNWQFAVENAETTLDPYGGGTRIFSTSAFFPDLVARYNFKVDVGNFSVAALLRQLNHEYEEDDVTKKNSTPGFGVSLGGKIKIGPKDDLRFQASGGNGLGRYAALNFANAAAVKEDNTLKPIPSFLGFVSFRHIWNQTLRSNFNVSGISITNDSNIVGDEVNKSAWSISGNILYSPVKPLTFGLELMHAKREIEEGTKGSFNRLQFSAQYAFNFSTTMNK